MRARTTAKAALLALALLVAWPGYLQEPAAWKDVPRVVVIPDVHGAYASLVELLQATTLIGPDLGWIGGTTHLVSLGHLIDRGADSSKVLDLVMRLQREAAATHGYVHIVLGNHELMNLLGDLRGGLVTLERGAVSSIAKGEGTALVASTVPRNIDGQESTLQLRCPDAITEADRLARGLRLSGWCPIEPQLQLLRAFDLLTFNRNRSAANLVLTNDLTDLTIVDHRHAFGTDRDLPARIDLSKVEIPRPLAAALTALDEPRLMASLGAWLDPPRIRALLARRDQLLAPR